MFVYACVCIALSYRYLYLDACMHIWIVYLFAFVKHTLKHSSAGVHMVKCYWGWKTFLGPVIVLVIEFNLSL